MNEAEANKIFYDKYGINSAIKELNKILTLKEEENDN